jgi:hypothetical protein
VSLSAECAATQVEQDTRRQNELDVETKGLKKLTWAIEQKYTTLREQVKAEHEQRLAKVAGRYETDKAALAAADKAKRQRIEMERTGIEKDVRAQLEKAEWLAESVMEAAQIQAAGEFKSAKDKIADHLQRMGDLERQMLGFMAKYGVELPQPVAPKIKFRKPGDAEEDLPPEPVKEEEHVHAPKPEESTAAFDKDIALAEGQARAMGRLSIPNFMVGLKPFAAGTLFCLLAVGATQLVAGGSDLAPQLAPDGAALGGALVVVLIAVIVLKNIGKKQVLAAYGPLRKTLDQVKKDTDSELEYAVRRREDFLAQAETKRQVEIQVAKDGLLPRVSEANRRRDQSKSAAAADYNRQIARLETVRKDGLADVTKWHKAESQKIEDEYEAEVLGLHRKNEARFAEIEKQFADDRAALEAKWAEGLKRIQEPIEVEGHMPLDWNDGAWSNWKAPKTFAQTVRFGEMQVDPRQIINQLPQADRFNLPLPETFTVPAQLAFPRQSSLLLQADRGGRGQAIGTLQMVMARLLTTIPPGRVKFTILDPVGLGQNFAGFMHLAYYDESLVGSRIWTDGDQIDQRMANLTEHMETVIQKYLRNEYATIDEYNKQAGELAEPYRFLVIADFPVNFTDDAFRRLSSIATTGSRCGVYTLVYRDTRQPVGQAGCLEDLVAHSVNLVWDKDHFVWNDEIFKRFPLTLDAPPSEDALTKVLHVVGPAAKESNRVEVSFDTIAPKAADFWTGSTRTDFAVPIGRSGATRLQSLKLGRGVAQHVLIAGKTGSGKSTLLHAIITNAAMWYGADQVEMYLIDFKKGVEFKTYATHALPHARAIAVESDREFGLSVLQRIDGALIRRGNLFRKAGVQDLNAYRGTDGAEVMPRTLLIIDEFQEFFSEDDKLSQEASLLLDRLVRQGRAFGIHVLLGSQTIGGTSGLSRSTIGQMGVRIALQTSEADSQLILGDGNSAARLLARPGEAIYNDAGGLVEGNSPFQIAWLTDERRDQFLDQISEKNRGKNYFEPPIVFEGNAAADVTKNHRLEKLISATEWPMASVAPMAWLGDPVAIKDPTAVFFRRQSGANMLMVGQADEQAMAMLTTSMVGLASQFPPDKAVFYVLDGSPQDSPLAGVMGTIKEAIPHEVKLIGIRQTGDALNEIAQDLSKRRETEHPDAPTIFLVVFALQRYRDLRKSEDAGFSFSASDEPEKPKPDKQFAEIFREGPVLGIHVMTWIDSLVSVDRTLDRNAMREFDNRVLFQMSASDSSNLIDSPAANKLGQHRALWYSEEQGVMEKFRPYAIPSREWLGHVKEKFSARGGTAAPAGATA